MAKAPSALLKKPKSTDKGYTKTQLIAHLTEAINGQDIGEVNKKQVTAILDELSEVLIKYAPVGATLPGIGKLQLKKTPPRPARKGRNPQTGEEIDITQTSRQKTCFRVSVQAKRAAGIA